jgi:hypothetical protein
MGARDQAVFIVLMTRVCVVDQPVKGGSMAGARKLTVRREQVVAASLVGAVVVVVGFASGMGIRQQTVTVPGPAPGVSDQPHQNRAATEGDYPQVVPVVELAPGVGNLLAVQVPHSSAPPVPAPAPAPDVPPVDPVVEQPVTEPEPTCQPGVLGTVVDTVVSTVSGQRITAPGAPDTAPTGLVTGLLGTCLINLSGG